MIARGGDHLDVFAALGRSDWRALWPAFERAYGGFQLADLYPDALPALAELRAAGYRVAIIANQPAARHDQLVALGVDADLIAMSEAIGVSKPDQAFFARALELMGSPPPSRVTYVGDRVDNDVLPALASGMRTVWLRRGPWAVLQQLPAGVDVPWVSGLRGLREALPGHRVVADR